MLQAQSGNLASKSTILHISARRNHDECTPLLTHNLVNRRARDSRASITRPLRPLVIRWEDHVHWGQLKKSRIRDPPKERAIVPATRQRSIGTLDGSAAFLPIHLCRPASLPKHNRCNMSNIARTQKMHIFANSIQYTGYVYFICLIHICCSFTYMFISWFAFSIIYSDICDICDIYT